MTARIRSGSRHRRESIMKRTSLVLMFLVVVILFFLFDITDK